MPFWHFGNTDCFLMYIPNFMGFPLSSPHFTGFPLCSPHRMPLLVGCSSIKTFAATNRQSGGTYVGAHTHTHTHTHAQTHTRTHTPLKESTHTTPPDHSSCPSPRYYEDVRRLPPVMPQQMKAHLARLSQSYNHELLMSGQGVNMDRVLYSLFGCVSKYSDEVRSNTHTRTHT